MTDTDAVVGAGAERPGATDADVAAVVVLNMAAPVPAARDADAADATAFPSSSSARLLWAPPFRYASYSPTRLPPRTQRSRYAARRSAASAMSAGQ